MTSFFTTSLSLLKSTGTGTNLPMPNLSTSDFTLAKFVFTAKLGVSIKFKNFIYKISFKRLHLKTLFIKFNLKDYI